MRAGWIWSGPAVAVAVAAIPACTGATTTSMDAMYTPPDTSAGGSTHAGGTTHTGGAAGGIGAAGVGASGGAGSGGASGAAAKGGASGTGAGGSSVAASGLPCDLAALLQSRCDSCHGSPPTQGAPASLVTWADLQAPSPGDPTKTHAEAALARMQDAIHPMPPKPNAPATAAEIAILQGWIQSGEPKGTCGGGSGGAGGSAGTTGTGGASGTGGSGAGGAPAQMGIPCDVAAVLASKCLSCHGSPLAGGAPMPLVGYADLTKPSFSDPTKTFAEVSAARMVDAVSPMPPKSANAATAMDVQVIQAWVQSGSPMGTCGAGGSGGGPTAPPPEACSAANMGTTAESSQMNPGRPCMSCHAPGGEAAEKAFAFGGTLYPKGHNMMSQCNGINGATGALAGASVVVTDAKGTQYKVSVGSTGNFYRYATAAFAPPYTAEVLMADGSTNKMGTAQSSGDCNSCHTDTGANGAPGRMWTPLARTDRAIPEAGTACPCWARNRLLGGSDVDRRNLGTDRRSRATHDLPLRLATRRRRRRAAARPRRRVRAVRAAGGADAASRGLRRGHALTPCPVRLTRGIVTARARRVVATRHDDADDEEPVDGSCGVKGASETRHHN